MINAVARFSFGPGIDIETELRDVAAKLTYAEPSAMLLSLGPEMFQGGIGRARLHQKLIAEASGMATFTTTGGILHRLRSVGASSVGLIAPAPQERMEEVGTSGCGSLGVWKLWNVLDSRPGPRLRWCMPTTSG